METLMGVVVGGLIVLLGIYMLVSGDVRLLHSYHYATTPEAERPLLARETGGCLVVAGASTALIIQTALPDWATVVGLVLLVASVVAMLVAIVRHNGGLVTAAPGPGIAGFGPRGTMTVALVAGGLLSLVGFVPGVYMLVTGDVSMLHGYHYVNVAASDIPALATGVGLAAVGLGVSLLLGAAAIGGSAALSPAPRWSRVLTAVAGVLLLASLVAMNLVIMRYNGSLMGE